MALQRLKDAAEKAKKDLSGVTSTQISLPFITAGEAGPLHLEMTLTRAKFDDLTRDLVERTKTPVRQALSDAGLSLSDIDEVILVGGSTRIPAVVEAVKAETGKEPNKSVNPDEVVAMGAAIQGGVITGDVKDVVLLDVTPLSLGIETMGGVFQNLLTATLLFQHLNHKSSQLQQITNQPLISMFFKGNAQWQQITRLLDASN